MRCLDWVREAKNPVRKLILFILLATGSLLVIFGILLILLYPKIVEDEIRKKSVLKPGTLLYKKWQNPPYTIKSEIYIHSVVNPDEIMNGSIPVVTTVGPYVYDVRLWNKVLSVQKGIAKYSAHTKLYFNKSKSCAKCSPKTKVWIPNVVYQKVVEAASSPSMKAAQTALATQKPFLEVAVEDMLFKGYKDPFLDKVCSIPFMNFICESVLDLPEKIVFFAEKNNSHRGTFEASTGEYDNAQSLGTLLSWNGKSTVPRHWWNDDYATMINGSDGSLFSPFIKKTDRLYIFAPELCRSIYLVFDKESVYKGVPTYRFKVPAEVFNSNLPENEGFCYHSGKKFFSNYEKCLPSGLLDISRCQKGDPPIIISLPNYLFADVSVKNSIVGLNESSLEHDGILVEIEPRTATAVRIHKRSQVNIAMWKGIDIIIGANLSKMRSSIVPIFSCFELYEIDDDSLNLLLTKLIRIDVALSVISKALICCGTVILVVVVAILILKSRSVASYLQNRGDRVGSATVHPVRSRKSHAINSSDRRYL